VGNLILDKGEAWVYHGSNFISIQVGDESEDILKII
jgi:hypothetical protein